MWRESSQTEESCCASENAKQGFILTLRQAQRLLRLPRQLVAHVMNGQVGVESSGVCGPVRVEAVDWHTTQGAQRPFSDCEVDPDPDLLVTEGVTPCHRTAPHLDCERLSVYFVFRLLYYGHFYFTFSQLNGVTPTSLEIVVCTYVNR